MTGAIGVPPIRLLIADGDPAVLAALGDLFGGEPGISVVAIAADAAEAVRLAADLRPDVVIIDVKVSGGGGPSAIREISRLSPPIRVVAHSAQVDQAVVAEMIRAGATSFVMKGAPIAEIIDAVERASRGQASLSAETVGSVALALDEQLSSSEQMLRRRRRTKAEVTRALVPGGLRAEFQPIFELKHLRLLGYEALARFDLEPVRGPDRWFAAAAEVGLGAELEMAAVRAAMSPLDDVPSGAYLSLNLSPSTIVSGEVDLVAAGLGDERIVLEVTEHAAVADYDALTQALAPLRAAGTRLAVDDAGSGFASLRHILRLNPDIIKLDIDLTRGIDVDRARRSLASALIAFSFEMGIDVVAEGIETQAELDSLVSLGAHGGQGFFLGRPGVLPPRDGR